MLSMLCMTKLDTTLALMTHPTISGWQLILEYPYLTLKVYLLRVKNIYLQHQNVALLYSIYSVSWHFQQWQHTKKQCWPIGKLQKRSVNFSVWYCQIFLVWKQCKEKTGWLLLTSLQYATPATINLPIPIREFNLWQLSYNTTMHCIE